MWSDGTDVFFLEMMLKIRIFSTNVLAKCEGIGKQTVHALRSLQASHSFGDVGLPHLKIDYYFASRRSWSRHPTLPWVLGTDSFWLCLIVRTPLKWPTKLKIRQFFQHINYFIQVYCEPVTYSSPSSVELRSLPCDPSHDGAERMGIRQGTFQTWLQIVCFGFVDSSLLDFYSLTVTKFRCRNIRKFHDKWEGIEETVRSYNKILEFSWSASNKSAWLSAQFHQLKISFLKNRSVKWTKEHHK